MSKLDEMCDYFDKYFASNKQKVFDHLEELEQIGQIPDELVKMINDHLVAEENAENEAKARAEEEAKKKAEIELSTKEGQEKARKEAAEKAAKEAEEKASRKAEKKSMRTIVVPRHQAASALVEEEQPEKGQAVSVQPLQNKTPLSSK